MLGGFGVTVLSDFPPKNLNRHILSGFRIGWQLLHLGLGYSLGNMCDFGLAETAIRRCFGLRNGFRCWCFSGALD
ncbi:hypothetical protein COY17_03440 [Candidatus Saccharibacteria bacterium CG_4_10_14_0_2_um_filter_52_9]|nr:MAG: hypothetical protein COY17_03440 [Candidatus Saccharibacteria bacterium CG_4_10_14_0_2_um_filter_52_9]